jgi:hypothetical protein
MNVNFLSSYNNDKMSALPTLKAEYEKNLEASRDILKAAKLIDKMEHQIGQWSTQKNFNKLFEEFKNNIKEVNQLISIDGEHKLAGNLATKQLYRLVDTIDLSIKQVQNSQVYEDKEQQVKNFKAMLGEFLNLMDKKIDINKDRIQAMKGLLSSKDNSNSIDELLPSRDFSVIKADFFQDSSGGFNSIGFPKCAKLADLHTLIHQSLLGFIARDSAKNNEELIRVLPELVQKMNTDILSKNSNIIKNSFSDYKKDTSLLYIDLAHPQVSLYYKVPLNNHSGTLKFEYNAQNKKVKLDCTYFGMGDERWKRLREVAFLLFETYTDAKLIEHKVSNEVLNFKVEINQDTQKLKEVVEIIDIISAATLFISADFFYSGGKFDKILQANGLSEFSINAYRDIEGDLDYKNFKGTIDKLKSSNKQFQNAIEKEAFIRIIAMDKLRNIDNNILKRVREEITSIPEYDELDLVGLVNNNIPELSLYGYSILANELLIKGDIKNAIKIVNMITLSDSPNYAQYYDNKYLNILALKLLEKDFISDAIKIAEKIMDQDHLYLGNIALKLIEKDFISDAIKIAEKGMSLYKLRDLIQKLIEKDRLMEAAKLSERIMDVQVLKEVSLKLIEKNYLNEAVKIIEKITNPGDLAAVAQKLLEKDQVSEAIKVAERITDSSYLASFAQNLIEKGHVSEAIKVAERITDSQSLAYFAQNLIENGHPNEAVKVAEKMTDQYILNRVALDLVEKNYAKEAAKVVERITLPTDLKLISLKLQNLFSFVSGNKEIDNSCKSSTILPFAEAVDQNSYRKVSNGNLVEEFEKPSKQFVPEKDAMSFINQHNPQIKLPRVPLRDENFTQAKLPETDMTAAAVVLARGVKFLVNKFTAKTIEAPSDNKFPKRKKIAKAK